MKDARPVFPLFILASLIGLLAGIGIYPDNRLMWWTAGACCALFVRDLADYLGQREGLKQ